MRLRPLILFLIFSFVLPASAAPNSLELDLRYHNNLALPDSIDQAAIYSHPFLPWLDGEFGVRLSQSLQNFESLDYKAELTAHFLIVGYSTFRLLTINRLAESFGSTTLLLTAGAKVPLFNFLTVYGDFGWYERYNLLGHVPIIPTFYQNNIYPDHDFALRLGFEIFPIRHFKALLGIGTYETLDVFNLNNPFLQFDVEYTPEGKNWTALLVTRYRMTLGFGRADEWMFGAGVRFPMDQVASATTQAP